MFQITKVLKNRIFSVNLHVKIRNTMNELPQKYNPAEVEDKWYAYWL